MNFLLYISYDYGFPIVRPLQDEILKRGHKVAWFIEIEESKKKLKPTEALLNTVEEVMVFKPNAVLVACNEVPHFFPGIKVQIFHGLDYDKRGLGGKGHFNIRGLFDLYCTRGPKETSIFKALSKKHQHFEVIETGWSKVDELFPVSEVQNSKPTIMIASTFTKSMSLAHNNQFFEELKKLILSKDWNWLITLHPKMDIEIINKFESLDMYENVTYLSRLDNLDSLKEADIMICDTSSILIEFIIQSKPVVTFNNKNPKNHLINITEVCDLEKSIQLAQERPEELMMEIDTYINDIHPYSDGKSSKRVVDAVEDFLNNNEKDKLKRKPLNLVRKFKIRKKLHYFSWKNYNKPFET